MNWRAFGAKNLYARFMSMYREKVHRKCWSENFRNQFQFQTISRECFLIADVALRWFPAPMVFPHTPTDISLYLLISQDQDFKIWMFNDVTQFRWAMMRLILFGMVFAWIAAHGGKGKIFCIFILYPYEVLKDLMYYIQLIS